jgi:hypothetical protein
MQPLSLYAASKWPDCIWAAHSNTLQTPNPTSNTCDPYQSERDATRQQHAQHETWSRKTKAGSMSPYAGMTFRFWPQSMFIMALGGWGPKTDAIEAVSVSYCTSGNGPTRYSGDDRPKMIQSLPTTPVANHNGC